MPTGTRSLSQPGLTLPRRSVQRICHTQSSLTAWQHGAALSASAGHGHHPVLDPAAEPVLCLQASGEGAEPASTELQQSQPVPMAGLEQAADITDPSTQTVLHLSRPLRQALAVRCVAVTSIPQVRHARGVIAHCKCPLAQYPGAHIKLHLGIVPKCIPAAHTCALHRVWQH